MLCAVQGYYHLFCSQSGAEFVFLKTASDRSTYRFIMLAAGGLLSVTAGYGLFSLASGKNKIQ